LAVDAHGLVWKIAALKVGIILDILRVAALTLVGISKFAAISLSSYSWPSLMN
jgi:hypothetical protein